MDALGREVSVNILRKRDQSGNNIGRGSRGISRVSLIGYFILTMVIIWIPALVTTGGNAAWFAPLLLTLFFLALGWIVLRYVREDYY